MFRRSPSAAAGKLTPAVVFLFSLVTVGTWFYWFIGEGKYPLVDCLYMTVITITTIGYSEIIDLAGNPTGRLFTMALAVSGVGTMTYILVNAAAFIIEGELNETFRRKKMDKTIAALREHYIVCGLPGVGAFILQELHRTNRPCVLVEPNEEEIRIFREKFDGLVYIQGDPTDSDTLAAAGVARAKGLFAVRRDDNFNLVVSLTAKQLNRSVKVIARCDNVKNEGKMRSAGADNVISPASIGGLRMASEMFRPSVVSFLDVMLRQDDSNLRIEEMTVPAALDGRPIATLDLKRFATLLLLALKTGERWHYNPARDQVLREGDTFVFMASPEERRALEEAFGAGGARD